MPSVTSRAMPFCRALLHWQRSQVPTRPRMLCIMMLWCSSSHRSWVRILASAKIGRLVAYVQVWGLSLGKIPKSASERLSMLEECLAREDASSWGWGECNNYIRHTNAFRYIPGKAFLPCTATLGGHSGMQVCKYCSVAGWALQLPVCKYVSIAQKLGGHSSMPVCKYCSVAGWALRYASM
eukprot:1155177-Pelagomonas_calceolata.AAC.1